MSSKTPAKPSKTGLSLYANLLDPAGPASTPGTISRAPVVFKPTQDEASRLDEASAQKQQLSAAALRFQPTKRPQVNNQKSKPKATSARPIVTPQASASQSNASLDSVINATRAPPKTSIADWTGDGDDDDVNGFYGGEKRQRGGRKKRKKNKEEAHVAQNWDDIYDPSRPNNYEEYKISDEKVLEVREWKDRLYAHRIAKQHSDSSDSEDGADSRPQMKNQFAPPMSFAPPAILKGPPQISDSARTVARNPPGEDEVARQQRSHAHIDDSETDMRPTPLVFLPQEIPPPPPPSTADLPPQKPPPHQPPTEATAPPTISRAPVRYNLPAAPSDIPTSEAELEDALQQEAEAVKAGTVQEDAPRSLRPGQKGFAARLMSKYGWTKGSGLGASGSGIVDPLRVQIEKQKKKPDSEGGGFAGPGGRGKIIGGKKKRGDSGESNEGRFGAMSEVVVLKGMVDGMDLDKEMDDGGLMQEIGEECGDKYGRVERVFIDRSSPASAPVFVKFTSQLSALRAVNALEGRIFNGNTITARFFDTEKFEEGIYTEK